MAESVNGKIVLDPARAAPQDRHRVAAPGREPSLGRVLWDAWKAYSHRASAYQATLLLSLVYYLVLGPSALAARLFGTKLLDLDTRPRASYWLQRQAADKSVAALERQF